MSLRFTVTVPIGVRAVEEQDVVAAVAAAVIGADLRYTPPSVSRPVGDAGSDSATAYFELFANDEAALQPAIDRMLETLGRHGIEVLRAPTIVPGGSDAGATATIPGVSYEPHSQTLAIQTWAPDQHDVEIHLGAGFPDAGCVATLVSTGADGERLEWSFPVRHLRVERPAGGPPTSP
jgi:hypothetical protein